MYDGKCQSCDEYGEVDGNMLCRDCNSQLDRDMIRSRQWVYSVRAWALSEKDREELREAIISEYGPEYELIEDPATQA